MAIELTETRVLETLQHGAIEEKGLLPYSSNHSFLVVVAHENLTLPAVYKPQRGEAPLWDFEWGTLCKRETAAYEVSRALGWNLVPPTVLREGSRGLGSVQFFVDHDSEAHYFTAAEDARYAEAFRRLALFDFVVNNADRKSGHCLIGHDGRVWAIDHGICFHHEYKLRTVIWEFSCTPIAMNDLADLAALRAALDDQANPFGQRIARLVSPPELAAMHRRIDHLLRVRSYPAPSLQRRNYPWPPI
ncbi:MAG TPA: SCO1664 family protein [Chloroflexi bacterium]|nr:SCO1664 family protein [Chloroflexota bacterium]HHW86272.1 SCO1664 family protein [Chloroflexota bacterium]